MIPSEAWTGPAAVAGGVLVVAGIAKLRRPDGAAGALRMAGLPVGPGAVRVGAAAETATGAWAVLAGSPAAHAALALWYGAFSVFLAVVLFRSLPVSSCGCLGEPDVPPSWTHLFFDLAAVAVAMGAGVSGAPSFLSVAAGQPWGGLPFAVLTLTGVAAGALVIGWLPGLAAVGRER